MSEDLNKLRELAEAATPGPWQNGFDDLDGVISLGSKDEGNVVCLPPDAIMELSLDRWAANAAFIAAFNPATALSLIARLQAAEERAEKAEGALAVVRMSRGWQYMSDETKALIEAAITRAALKTEGA